MRWIKKILKLNIHLIYFSSDKDRSANTLPTKIKTSSFSYIDEIYVKTCPCKDDIIYSYALFNKRNFRITQIYLWVFPSISLGRSFEENVRRQCLALRGEMRDEIRRLMSFAGTPVDASRIRLASAGFFATGVGDQTMCFSCGIMHSGWQRSNDPATVHRSISPDCLHAARSDDRNVRPVPFRLPGLATAPTPEDHLDSLASTSSSAISPDESSVEASRGKHQDREQLESTENNSRENRPEIRQVTDETRLYLESGTSEINSNTPDFRVHNTNLDRCVYPQYKALTERLNSFQQWPMAHCKKPEDLASAGFFYAGYGDCVRCFFCGVGLKNWEEGDDPWKEHVRWRSSCEYARSVKGEEFMKTMMGTVNERGTMDHLQTNKPPNPAPASADFNHYENIYRKALEMGFSRDTVIHQLRQLVHDCGGDQLTPECLITSLIQEYGDPGVTTLREDCDEHQPDVQLQDPGKEEDMEGPTGRMKR